VADHEPLGGWVEFSRSMAAMMAPSAEFLGGYCAKHKQGEVRVLDIAAGHGLFGIGVPRCRHRRGAWFRALPTRPVRQEVSRNPGGVFARGPLGTACL